MAERIVSPGVFTRERDLSFLPQGIGEIGAAIIGPTSIGPAFTPTQITSYQEFEEVFGGTDARFYTPYTVEQYLRSAGVVTIVRVLGLGGYKVDSVRLVAHSDTASGLTSTSSLAVLAPSLGTSATADLSVTAMSASATAASFTAEHQGKRFIEFTDELFNTWKPRIAFEVIDADEDIKKVQTHNLVY